jgi:epoxyqueuosine reductase
LSPEDRSERTKKLAGRLGFDAVGITEATPLSGFARFQDWLSRGYQGEMRYLERSADRRHDVRSVAPFARSVVVVLQNYRPDGANLPPAGSAAEGAARYARGKDYHFTIPKRLGRLVEDLRADLGEPFQARVYADTGPLLERELAVRAGLGWIGKSTLLISRSLGTYTLIGIVLTSLEMAPDAPFASDHCGTCRSCIQACPTGAIVDDRTLDARACISYWTIENRGKAPEEFREVRTRWWFGCDICQEVCPWNRFAPATVSRDLAPMPVLRQNSPGDLLKMSKRSFRDVFRESPIRRAKFEGFIRNLQRATGQVGDPPDGDEGHPTRAVRRDTEGSPAKAPSQIPFGGVSRDGL